MAPLQRFLVADGLDGAAAEGFLSQERSVGLGAGFTLVVQRTGVNRAMAWGRDDVEPRGRLGGVRAAEGNTGVGEVPHVGRHLSG